MNLNTNSTPIKKEYPVGKTSVVYSEYVADELLYRGEELLFTRPNLKMKDRDVFIFRTTETFSDNLHEIVEQLQQYRKNLEVK